jgi:hypothetical protein
MIDLKYPEYQKDRLTSSDETLFSQKEVTDMLDYKKGSKNLVWNNFFKEIGKNKHY